LVILATDCSGNASGDNNFGGSLTETTCLLLTC